MTWVDLRRFRSMPGRVEALTLPSHARQVLGRNLKCSETRWPAGGGVGQGGARHRPKFWDYPACPRGRTVDDPTATRRSSTALVSDSYGRAMILRRSLLRRLGGLLLLGS